MNIVDCIQLFALVLGVFGVLIAGEFCNDPLNCALSKVVINIPEVTLTVPNGELTIKSLVCKELSIQSYPSEYVPPTTLRLSFDGLHMDCDGIYIYDTGRVFVYSGDLDVQIFDTNATIDYYLEKEDGGELPVAMSFSDCYYPIINVNVDFQGNAGVDFTALASAVEVFIRATMKSLLCIKLARKVANNGTYALLNTVDPVLMTIISAAPEAPPELEFPYVSWKDTVLGSLVALSNSALTQKLANCAADQFPDSTSTPFRDVIRELLPHDPSLGLFIPVNKTIEIMNGTYSVDSLSVFGIDSLNFNELLRPSATSNASLATSFRCGRLVLRVNSTVEAEDPQDYSRQRQFEISINNLTIAVDFVLGVNKSALGGLHIDQFTFPACVLSTIDVINVTSLDVNISVNMLSLDHVSTDEDIEQSALERSRVDLFDNAFALMADGFGDLTSDLIHGVFQGVIRVAVNERIAADLIELKINATCPSHQPSSVANTTNIFISWVNSTIISFIDKFVEGPGSINQLMNCVTDDTGKLSIELNSWIIEVGGLSNFYEISLLTPYPKSLVDVYPYNLISSVGLGHCQVDNSFLTAPSISNCDPFSIKFISKSSSANIIPVTAVSTSLLAGDFGRYILDLDEQDFVELSDLLDSEESPVSNLLTYVSSYVKPGSTLQFSVANLFIYLDLFVKVSQGLLGDTFVNQLGTKGCVAQSINSLYVHELNISLSNASLSVVKGGSDANVIDITVLLDQAISRLSSATRLANRNARIQEKLLLAPATCLNGGISPYVNDDVVDPIGSSTLPPLTITLVVLAMVISVGGIYFVNSFCCNPRVKSASFGSKSFVYSPLTEDLLTSDEKEDRVNEKVLIEQNQAVRTTTHDSWIQRWLKPWQSALICDSRLSSIVRYGMVAAILANIYILIINNMEPKGILVIADLYIGNKHVTLPPIFTFGFAGTVQDMWDSKAYFLAILIAFFTGGWPYLKLLTMLFCWCCPTTTLSVENRGNLLRITDFLGKWGFVDFYFMVMLMCAFMITINFGEQISVDVTVDPKWGFFGMFSIMISIVLGHVAVLFHRYSVDDGQTGLETTNMDEEAQPESIFSHVYCLSHAVINDMGRLVSWVGNQVDGETSEGAKGGEYSSNFGSMVFVRATSGAKIVSALTLVVAVILIYFGTTMDSLAFHFKGLTALLLQGNSDVFYSFVELGSNLPAASGKPKQFTNLFMQAAFFAFGLVLPALLVMGFAIILFIPFSLRVQRRLLAGIEVINAWASLEVFCVAITAALFEIEQFALYIVGDKCDGINKLLAAIDSHVPYNGIDQCFDIVTSLSSDCWSLFCAAGLLLLISIPTISLCEAVVQDRIKSGMFIRSLTLLASSTAATALSSDNWSATSTSARVEPGYHVPSQSRLSHSVTGNSTTFRDVLVKSAPTEQSAAVHIPMNESMAGDEKPSYVERFQFMIVQTLLYLHLVEVVDPNDVSGLERLGVGVASTLSHSLKFQNVDSNSSGSAQVE